MQGIVAGITGVTIIPEITRAIIRITRIITRIITRMLATRIITRWLWTLRTFRLLHRRLVKRMELRLVNPILLRMLYHSDGMI